MDEVETDVRVVVVADVDRKVDVGDSGEVDQAEFAEREDRDEEAAPGGSQGLRDTLLGARAIRDHKLDHDTHIVAGRQLDPIRTHADRNPGQVVPWGSQAVVEILVPEDRLPLLSWIFPVGPHLNAKPAMASFTAELPLRRALARFLRRSHVLRKPSASLVSPSGSHHHGGASGQEARQVREIPLAGGGFLPSEETPFRLKWPGRWAEPRWMAGRQSKRSSERVKKRLSCELRADGRSYRGMVLDMSQEGLFVQCHARLRPGQDVAVTLTVQGRAEPFELATQVARAKRVPVQLRSVVGGGIGLRISEPPEAYTAFVDSARSTRGSGRLEFEPGKAS